MNVRQFLNSTICAAVERSARARNSLYMLPKFLFPEFMKGALKLRSIDNPLRFGALIYVLVFIPVFLVQAVLAYKNGVLLPDDNNIKDFLEDYANLANYVVFVEAYCISGVFFLYYSRNMEKFLQASKLTNHLKLDSPASSATGGYLTILFVVLSSLAAGVGYALEVQSYPAYWYMARDSSPVISEFAGYYYLYLNFVLLLFVVIVGVAHFGLFRTASSISKGLREVYRSSDIEQLRQWGSDHGVKEWLAPFSAQVLVSKIFVLSCVLNVMSWKMGEASIGKMHDMSVVVMVIVGMWIVTLPRYFLQYQIFRIRQRIGVMEYKDIRMPWVIGGSACVDMVLILIVGKVLLNNRTLVDLAERVFGS